MIPAVILAAALASAPPQWQLYETAPYKVWGSFPTVELCMGAAIREQPRLKAGAVGCKAELPAIGGRP